ncbi:hypothetical protein PHOBOS_67 [Erwinia phage vB_EamM_Phobos]|uniref:hypothetical protein n=1 Tax=Erwinia phage vB_EamM_Phobos TaxID=1883377 RepID=UPI00081D2658|nr:hypothetical protein BIZ79_gp067 [Erwinia phage vB_EamM_Phobos]ANZ50257.1 hypothetical protein PHOBOS_67 [Erwinia phage vB_EamM_Phobos]
MRKLDNIDLLLKLSGKELGAVMAQIKAEKEAGQQLPPVKPFRGYDIEFNPRHIITKA